MSKIRSVLLASVLVCGAASHSAAQVQDEVSAAMEATLVHIRKGLAPGDIALTAIPERLKTRLATTAPNVTGAWVSRMDERDALIMCWAGETSCGISISGIIDVIDVVMQGNVAIVLAGITSGTYITQSKQLRTYYRQTRFVLQKRDGSWVVVSSEVVANG